MSNAAITLTVDGVQLAGDLLDKVGDAITRAGDAAVVTSTKSDAAGQVMERAFSRPTETAMSFANVVTDTVSAALHNVINDAESTEEAIKGLFEHPQDSMNAFGGAMREQVLSTLGPELVPVVGVAVAVLGGLGTTVMELGQHATTTGAEIAKIAMVSNTSAAGISDLKFALDATGGSAEQLNSVMFMFEKRMDTSSDAVDTGLKKVGLSLGAIQDMSSDQKLLAISEAFRNSGDDVNRASAAFEIFGKQGRDILPELMQDLTGLAAKSKELGNTWSDEDAKGAHEFEVAAKTMATETSSAWTQLGRDVAPVTNAIALGWDRSKLAVANVALTFAEVLSGGGWFTAMYDWMRNVEAEGPKVAASIKGLADGSGLAAKGVKDWTDQVKNYTGAAPSLSAALETEQEAIRDLDTETNKAIDLKTKHIAAVESAKTAIEGDSKSLKLNVEALDQLIAAGITDEDVKTRAIAMIDTLEAKHITLTDRTYEWSAAAGGATDAADKYGTAWANLASVGSDYADTVAALDPLLVAEIADYVEAGAKVSDLATAYRDVLTPAQVDAIEKMVRANDKYAASWVKTQDDIDRVWDRAFLTEQENDLRGLDLQLAKLDRQQQNEKDAAAKKITDETQLEAMLEAIDADYDARRETARRTNDQKLGDQLTVLWQGVYDAEAQAGETTSEKQIAAVQKWYDAEVDKAIKAGVVDQTYYDNLWALADRKTKDVIALNDPWAKANAKFRQDEETDWAKLYADIYGGWVDTFDQTLIKTGSFKDAASAVFGALKQDVEKIFADMLSNLLKGFFAPLETELGSMLAKLLGLGSAGGGSGGGLGGILGSLLGGGGGGGDTAGVGGVGGGDWGGDYGPAGPSSGAHGSDPGADQTGYFARGGVVPAPAYLAGGGFPGGPRGSDVTPVWATPGEMFITSDQQAAIIHGNRATVAAVQAMHASVSRYHQEIRTMLQMFPIQVRHALRGRQG